MEKQKAQPKPQPKTENDILSLMDLDTVLKHAAEGKRQIARGECYSFNESYANFLQKRNALIKNEK